MACFCLSCNSIPKSLVFACLSSNSNSSNGNNNYSPSPQSNTDFNPLILTPNRKTKASTLSRKKRQQSKLQQHIKLIHIERAIGAGSYRDSETKDSEQRNSIFKGLLPNSGGAMEGSVERKLRETGEWVANTTEGGFRASGHYHKEQYSLLCPGFPMDVWVRDARYVVKTIVESLTKDVSCSVASSSMACLIAIFVISKKILMFFIQWIMPIYMLLFLVASGVIKLPFSTPLLDDLIM